MLSRRCSRRAFSWGTALRSLSTSSQLYDVVIVGGGVVGASLACRLAEERSTQHLRIAVVEQQPPAKLDDIRKIADPDLRTFAIAPKSQQILQKAGAWERIASVRAPAYRDMHVWDSMSSGSLHFSAAAAGVPELGYIIENRVLQSALFDKMQELQREGRLDLLTGWNIEKVQLPPSTLDLLSPRIMAEETAGGSSSSRAGARGQSFEAGSLAELSLRPFVPAQRPGAPPSSSSPAPSASAPAAAPSPTVIQSRLVVGADGAESRIRASAGIGMWGWDYEQKAVVATVKAEGQQGVAWQRFLPNGPVAMLPLWDGYWSVVWSTTTRHADYLCGLPPADFLETLNTVLHAPTSSFKALLHGSAGGETESSSSGTGRTNLPMASLSASSSSSSAGDNGQQLYRQDRDALTADPLDLLLRLLDKGVDTFTGALSSAAALQGRADAAAIGSRPSAPLPCASSVVGPRGAFPLRLRLCNSYISPRVALIGDAAHSIHPMAGQGLNMGLADSEALAQTLAAGCSRGADPGSVHLLRGYERSRAVDNAAVHLGVDAIKRGFTSYVESEGLVLEHLSRARGSVLKLLNAVPAVKNALASRAMGF